ncbi:MAG: DUF4149 domain-containing protein [Burkholderiales bacterium]|nr:DUF4149 domain-containing protein [Burkholderiales bacterium]
MLGRAGAWIAGAWTGLMLGIGGVAAPALFSLLPRADAGRVAARLFSLEATIGVCAGAFLVLVGLQLGRDRAEGTQGSRFGLELILALAAVACIVAGYYALQPMLEAARAGQGSLSFAALHGISSVFFALRLALVAILAWRLSALPS